MHCCAAPSAILISQPQPASLVCGNRHSFDLARDGYVNLLDGRRRSLMARGDSVEQLDHRTAFLEAGHFNPVASAIAAHVSAATPVEGRRVLDAGCGTGHHLAGVSAALRTPVIGLGFDIARTAAQRAARRWRRLPLPSPTCGPNGRCRTRRRISCSASSRRRISPRCPASCDRVDGLPWPTRDPSPCRARPPLRSLAAACRQDRTLRRGDATVDRAIDGRSARAPRESRPRERSSRGVDGTERPSHRGLGARRRAAAMDVTIDIAMLFARKPG